MKNPYIEALKEVGRLVVFSIPGFIIQVVSGDAALSASYGGIILAILRSVDKAIHDNPDTPSNGLLPF